MKIRKNDNVLVIKGKDRGKQGRVQRVLPSEGRVVVEGVNMISRHTKARPGLRQAGIITREAPMNVSKVLLVCTQCGKPTRTGKKHLQEGSKARTCKKCQEVIE